MENEILEAEKSLTEGEESRKINENENNEKVENIPFKKPVLVGKIGRLPKKIRSCPTKPDSGITKANIEVLSDSNYSEKNETSIDQAATENVNQRTDNLILQYSEPSWSGVPKTSEVNYSFEVLKDGAIIDTVNLMGKPYWVFGRLANCDIPMQHPTISRYHAVLQYRSDRSEKDEPGFYIYDLGSTHGTFLNKNKLRPRVYVRIQVGHMLKLGCSTRNYLLNGPEEDTEEESELTITELKQKRQETMERIEREKLEETLRIQKEEEERKKKEEEDGIDWGMGEDANEETDLSENPYAQTTNEDLYLDDPKKTLRGFFEREGLELVYDCSDCGFGKFHCKVKLPVGDEREGAVYAEILGKGKKKDIVVQCALEACRILDRHGLLRQAVHESRKRKAKDWAENDYYDSDDDTFLDRTGTIEKKREKRMNAKNPQKAETYDSLVEKEQKLNETIKTTENQLKEAQQKLTSTTNTPSEEDSLDAFMKDLKDSKPDKSTINKLRNELTKLKQEHAKIIKLVNIARPASLPPLVPQYASDSSTSNAAKCKVLPVFGKRKKLPVSVPQKNPTTGEITNKDDTEEEEEEEEESVDQISDKLKKSLDSEVEQCGSKSEHGLRTAESVHSEADKDNSDISAMSINQGQFEDECKSLVNEIFTKFQRISSKLCMENTKEYKKDQERKFQSLISLVKQGATRILDDMDRILENETKERKVEAKEPSLTSNPDNNLAFNGDSADQMMKKKKNQRRIQQRQEKVEIEKQKGYLEDAEKEDYNMWVPPSDQKGDGKTKLNEKFGY